MATLASAANPVPNPAQIQRSSASSPVSGPSMSMNNGTHNYGAYHCPPPPFGTPFVSPNIVPTAAKPPTGIVKVGFYEVEATIGRGNFAVVKIAKHRVTKTDVSFLTNFNF